VLKLRRALESKDGAKANGLTSDVKVNFAKQIHLCQQLQCYRHNKWKL
jgi:hypothetical protein